MSTIPSAPNSSDYLLFSSQEQCLSLIQLPIPPGSSMTATNPINQALNFQTFLIELPDNQEELFPQLTVLESFTLFPSLPVELRLKIWRDHFPPPRHVCLNGELRMIKAWQVRRIRHLDKAKYKTFTEPLYRKFATLKAHFPTGLHVNRESRLETLNHFQIMDPPRQHYLDIPKYASFLRSKTAPIWIDASRDTCYIQSDPYVSKRNGTFWDSFSRLDYSSRLAIREVEIVFLLSLGSAAWDVINVRIDDALSLLPNVHTIVFSLEVFSMISDAWEDCKDNPGEENTLEHHFSLYDEDDEAGDLERLKKLARVNVWLRCLDEDYGPTQLHVPLASEKLKPGPKVYKLRTERVLRDVLAMKAKREG